MQQQPWIGKPATDIVFILLPPFFCVLLVMLFPGVFQNNSHIPAAGWVILILLIDVAHVYSTLYRTYFDPGAFRKQRFILTLIPFAGFIAGVLVYSISNMLFWRILAYTAVYHFIRQQYGFMRVYSRKENKKTTAAIVDKITIYYATIYPILYWHLKGPRNFNWFTDEDFIFLQSGLLLKAATALYIIVIATWLIKEARQWLITRHINIPKTAIILGTLLSWYLGIVYFNGDMAFTLLNVVSHGIPYMALVWIYGQKNYTRSGKGTRFLQLVFTRYGILIFLGLIFVFAFIEEGLWDITLWQEHKTIFGTSHLPSLTLGNQLLSFIVPLLALPQITHYILDGFIWKIKEDNFKWNNELSKT